MNAIIELDEPRKVDAAVVFKAQMLLADLLAGVIRGKKIRRTGCIALKVSRRARLVVEGDRCILFSSHNKYEQHISKGN